MIASLVEEPNVESINRNGQGESEFASGNSNIF
jgi:hypothetical protein